MKFEDIEINRSMKQVEPENWNIEAWRKENPVDYLKMFKILYEAEDSVRQAYLFQKLIMILHMYLPDVLYKYYSLSSDKNDSLNEKKFKTLADNKIYMADASELNDPFDGKGFFYNPNQLADIGNLKNHEGLLIDDFAPFLKSASLTANGTNSMPMWAHYAANHQGFCVSYRMDDEANLNLISCSHPVQYTEERVDITDYMKKYATMLFREADRQVKEGNSEIIIDDMSIVFMQLLFCNIKHKSWEYEKEFKCTMGSNAIGMPYVAVKPEKIFIGMKCRLEHEERLKKIAKEIKTPIYKMEFDEMSEDYKLITKKIM